jgi:hypothetical protein
MDLLMSLSPELIEYVEKIQIGLSAGLDPKLLLDRTPAAREKDLQRLRQIAKLAKTIPEFEDLHPQIQRSYAAVASPQAFAAQIDQLARMSTQHESIFALQELLDVWNHVGGIVGSIIEKTQYKKRNILLATSVSRSLSARTFLSPDGDVQVILFFARLFSFIEHVSLLLPLAVREDAMKTDSLDDFPQLVIEESESLSANMNLERTVRLMLERYRDGAVNLSRTWSHEFGQYQRLVAQDMASAMQFFVMAHELAHCMCEHQGTVLHWAFPSEGETTAGPADIREIERNWDQEFEADYLGFRLGMVVSQRHGIPHETYCWAGYLLFYGLSRCSPPSAKSASAAERWRQHESHPPLVERQKWLEEIAKTIEPSRTALKRPITFEPIKGLCRLLDKYV